jgi:glycogen phosphorylase
MADQRTIAYFSMEIALEAAMPTYSGGLGVLAGDTVRTAADLRLPMVGVTLLHRKGYFYQHLHKDGWQDEEAMEWPVEQFVSECSERVSVSLDGRTVHIRAWRYNLRGVTGHRVPILLLDTELPENDEQDRTLTDTLYGGDAYYRLRQEAILGIGGVKVLRALGYRDLQQFHMNEGHASLLTLALLEECATRAGRAKFSREDIEQVKQMCVFTTHTPVPAGHDMFSMDLAMAVLSHYDNIPEMADVFCHNDELNLTYLALNLSHYANGVSRRHGEVSRTMFPAYAVVHITNGVHANTWVADPIQRVFDEYTPGWREDNGQLRGAANIPLAELSHAHGKAKWQLIDYVNRETSCHMDVNRFTIGFARRTTRYKRATLLLHDLEYLKQIALRVGPLQVVYAGKAHPKDVEGKELIRTIFDIGSQMPDSVRIVFLENYDMVLGRMLTAGADVWLNNPEPPLEASGTSGMKAALNGVPNLSVLDGWWVEGHEEGITGWSIGGHEPEIDNAVDCRRRHAALLYEKLEHVVMPLYYQNHDRYVEVMRQSIAKNGSYFNTQRMLQEYVKDAYAM